MSKNFFDIFRETFGSSEEKTKRDAEGFTTIDIDLPDEASELVVYIFMNNGALLERDRIKEALKKVDAPWVASALEEIDKIPRSLPRENENTAETEK
jgi:hypothetical protein